MAPSNRTGSSRRWREHTVPKVLRRDGGICHLCGHPGATTADHLIPHAHGGTDDLDNLAAAHVRCNQVRGTRPIEQARAQLMPPTSTNTPGWTW